MNRPKVVPSMPQRRWFTNLGKKRYIQLYSDTKLVINVWSIQKNNGDSLTPSPTPNASLFNIAGESRAEIVAVLIMRLDGNVGYI